MFYFIKSKQIFINEAHIVTAEYKPPRKLDFEDGHGLVDVPAEMIITLNNYIDDPASNGDGSLACFGFRSNIVKITGEDACCALIIFKSHASWVF